MVAYCTIGMRSGLYTKELRERGIEAYNLMGSVLSWSHAGRDFEGADGPTRRVHVYGATWDLAGRRLRGVVVRWGAVLVLALGAVEASAEELRVDRETALFAVVTNKAGALSGLAHNHLVAARGWQARVDGSPGTLDGATFEIELPVAELLVDDPGLQAAWSPRLEALGILDGPFGELSEKNRREVRQAMLGPKQLDAERFAAVRARVTAITNGASTLGEVPFSHAVELAFEVRGRKMERRVAGADRVGG